MTAPNPDALLRRYQVAEALAALGFPVTTATLATKATRGGGPPFSKFGNSALYRWDDVLAWANASLRPSTAKGAQKHAA